MIKGWLYNILSRKYKRMCPGFHGSIIGVDIVNSTFEENVFIAHHAQMKNAHIGNHTSIGRFDKIRDADIGKYCSLSWDVTIGAPTHPYKTVTNCSLTYIKDYGVVNENICFPQKRTYVGNDVWVGCDATVISGVTIGDGAIIGAGAVVTKDVSPYAIVGGVPAREIGVRFSGEIVEVLEEIKWWDWSTEEIRQCLDLFRKDLDYETVIELRDKHREYKGDS